MTPELWVNLIAVCSVDWAGMYTWLIGANASYACEPQSKKSIQHINFSTECKRLQSS